MSIRRLGVHIDNSCCGATDEWLLIEDSHAKRWDLIGNGVYLGTLLWSPQRIRWEPRARDHGCQPSDTMLKLFHMLIRESSPVPRVMDCPNEPD